MNELSKELKKMLPKFGPGDVYEFELLGIKTRKIDGGRETKVYPSIKKIPASTVIYDPGAEQEVTLNYIKRVYPATNKHENERVELGKIEFKKSEKGRKILRGNNPADRKLFEYLYLCQWNASNVGQSYHVVNDNPNYKFKFVDNKAVNKNKLDAKKMKLQAMNIALSLSDKDMRILCEKLKSDPSIEPKFNFEDHWEDEDIRTRLVTFAENNPAKIITKNKEYNFAIEQLVRDAFDKKIISHDKAKKQIIWTKGKGLLITCAANKKPHNELANYFMTDEGKQDLEVIVAQLKSGDNDASDE
jgi:hypothetical protein